MPDVYRACASILVLRPKEGDVEVLLLHKPRKRDSWQLPQGGREEGETTEQTALRELQEEAGLSVTVLGRSARVYQYDFPPSYRRFRPDNVCGQRIEFVLARAPDDAVITVDGREIDRFAWVKPQDLSRSIKRKEYLSIIRGLLEEGRELLRSSS
ncbi:MAG: NUDIX domain-containing protein [Candidatus Peribacteraceae bacterium]|nr:NUDIX domain-containing protein [Candidatus Peribacteraceae bacterium]